MDDVKKTLKRTKKSLENSLHRKSRKNKFQKTKLDHSFDLNRSLKEDLFTLEDVIHLKGRKKKIHKTKLNDSYESLDIPPKQKWESDKIRKDILFHENLRRVIKEPRKSQDKATRKQLKGLARKIKRTGHVSDLMETKVKKLMKKL